MTWILLCKAPNANIVLVFYSPPLSSAPPVTQKPTPPKTCKAAGFSTCCTRSGSGCLVSAGNCWCDRACRAFRNCCPDIGTTCPRTGMLQIWLWIARKGCIRVPNRQVGIVSTCSSVPCDCMHALCFCHASNLHKCR